MKKSIALLLAALFILSALSFTACGGSKSEKKADDKNLSFTTVGELKKSGAEYDFIKSDSKLEDDGVVCQIKKDASGEVTIPAEHDGKTVVAVTGDLEKNFRVTSLSLESGVSYIEDCTLNGVGSVTLPATVKAIYSSFNDNTELKEISIPFSVKYIVNSFNKCEKLAKADTNGYVYGITDSFCEDYQLTDVAFNGSIQKMEFSFDGTAVKEINFVENIHDIVECFNVTETLQTVVFDQIAGGVKDSFNDDSALTTVTYKQGGEKITNSFNNNDALEKVDFGGGIGSISASFENCAKYKLPEAPAE